MGATLAPTSPIGSSVTMDGGAGVLQWSGESSSSGTIIGILGGACAFGFAITGLWIRGGKRRPPLSAEDFSQQACNEDTAGRTEEGEMVICSF